MILLNFKPDAEAKPVNVNWERISRLKPDLKIMIQVTSPNPISLEDLASMARLGMNPADRDPGLILGLKQAIFSVKLRHWNPQKLPAHLRAKLLDRFFMSGIYRVGFRVEQTGYEGPLTLEITAPRDGFGQQLIYSESMVRPRASQRLFIDSTGNRWFQVDYLKIRYGETIKFHFAFRYRSPLRLRLARGAVVRDLVDLALQPVAVLLGEINGESHCAGQTQCHEREKDAADFF